MLSAHTDQTYGPVRFDFDIVLARAFRVFTEYRTASTLDTRFSPPNGLHAPGRSILYLVLEGTLQWHDDPDLRFPATSAFSAPIEDVVGGNGNRTRAYAAFGDRYNNIEMWVPSSALRTPPQLPVRLELSAETFAAARAYAAHVRGTIEASSESRIGYLRPLLAGLRRDGVLVADLLQDERESRSVHEHVWNSFIPWLKPLLLSGSLDMLSHRAGLSLRQTGRRIDDICNYFELPWTGWRALSRGIRLRLAVLLLSNAELSVDDIAEAVGYSSPEALNHALRDEGLPPPVEIRRRILGLEATPSSRPRPCVHDTTRGAQGGL